VTVETPSPPAAALTPAGRLVFRATSPETGRPWSLALTPPPGAVDYLLAKMDDPDPAFAARLRDGWLGELTEHCESMISVVLPGGPGEPPSVEAVGRACFGVLMTAFPGGWRPDEPALIRDPLGHLYCVAASVLDEFPAGARGKVPAFWYTRA
jgi:hypothetical protein